MSARLVLCLGGTRSGKSRFGQRRAAELADGAEVIFIATARAGDPELERRIDVHRRARPRTWPTVEAGDDLAATLAALPDRRTLLLDGLTLWLSAAWYGSGLTVDGFLEGPLAQALAAIATRAGPVVIVSDEIGLGMVPMEAGMREFRDLQGLAHQRIAAAAHEVHLLVAGLPLALKPCPR